MACLYWILAEEGIGVGSVFCVVVSHWPGVWLGEYSSAPFLSEFSAQVWSLLHQDLRLNWFTLTCSCLPGMKLLTASLTKVWVQSPSLHQLRTLIPLSPLWPPSLEGGLLLSQTLRRFSYIFVSLSKKVPFRDLYCDTAGDFFHWRRRNSPSAVPGRQTSDGSLSAGRLQGQGRAMGRSWSLEEEAGHGCCFSSMTLGWSFNPLWTPVSSSLKSLYVAYLRGLLCRLNKMIPYEVLTTVPGIEVELNKCYLGVVVREEEEEHKEKEKKERKLERWPRMEGTVAIT